MRFFKIYALKSIPQKHFHTVILNFNEYKTIKSNHRHFESLMNYEISTSDDVCDGILKMYLHLKNPAHPDTGQGCFTNLAHVYKIVYYNSLFLHHSLG